MKLLTSFYPADNSCMQNSKILEHAAYINLKGYHFSTLIYEIDLIESSNNTWKDLVTKGNVESVLAAERMM